MRFYEWKKYRNTTVKPILMKSYNHEYYNDANKLFCDIERCYRMLAYINSNKSRPQNRYGRKLRVDKDWVEKELRIKLSQFNQILVLMKLEL